MKVIGLTGGIGSGKTTVSDLFGELGIDVVDADVVSRQLTAVNGGAMPEIIKQFGPEAASPDSSMNRRFIRELVFSDPEAKTVLENILHPLIRKECQRQLDASASGLPPVPFLSAPRPRPAFLPPDSFVPVCQVSEIAVIPDDFNGTVLEYTIVDFSSIYTS